MWAKRCTVLLLLLLAPICAEAQPQPRQASKNDAPSDPFLPNLQANPPGFLVKSLIEGRAVESLFESDFPKLEAAAKFYRDTQARTPGGAWKLSVFYDAIKCACDPENPHDEYRFRNADAKSVKWIAAYPRSPTPYIVYSEQLLAHAWFFYSDAPSLSDSGESQRKFEAYLAQARAVLERSKSFAAQDPQWYVAMLNIAYAQHWDKKHFEPVIKEGLDRYPYYTHIYFAASRLYLPSSGGNIDDLDTFIENAVARTAGREGTIIYARLYANSSYAFHNIFKTTHASWPKMYNALAELDRRYPDNRNDNMFAYFACAAGDKYATAWLLPRLRMAPPDYEIWRNQSNIDLCRSWATDKKAAAGVSPMPAWNEAPTNDWRNHLAALSLVLAIRILKMLF